jgi:hypothetical protein
MEGQKRKSPSEGWAWGCLVLKWLKGVFYLSPNLQILEINNSDPLNRKIVAYNVERSGA